MQLWQRFWQALMAYFRDRMGLTLAVLASLVAGVIVGALVARAAPAPTKDQLTQMLRLLVQQASQGEVGGWGLFWLSVVQNLRWLLVLWVLGVTVIGFLGVLPVIFARGFTAGFAVAVLADAMGFRGVLLSLFALFPQLALSVPTLLAAAVIALSFSRHLFAAGSRGARKSFIPDLLGFTVMVGLLTVPLLAASLLEAFISPVFLRLVGGGW
ncbi:MAG: stage II sporulation protein M [Symbiobacteriia bacterium]